MSLNKRKMKLKQVMKGTMKKVMKEMMKEVYKLNHLVLLIETKEHPKIQGVHLQFLEI